MCGSPGSTHEPCDGTEWRLRCRSRTSPRPSTSRLRGRLRSRPVATPGSRTSCGPSTRRRAPRPSCRPRWRWHTVDVGGSEPVTKGLRAFQEADADDFFGRDDLVERLVSRPSTRTDWWRVVGPVGVGQVERGEGRAVGPDPEPTRAGRSGCRPRCSPARSRSRSWRGRCCVWG